LISERLLTTHDESDWRGVLPTNKNVFGSVEFARIYEENSGYSARLFVVKLDDSLIAYPLFLRPIQVLPFSSGVSAIAWDTLTPEYTGPLLFGTPSTTLSTAFRERFKALCQSEGIVAEFAHLTPWGAVTDALCTDGVAWDREIVFVDTTQSETQLWEEHLTRACRKNIKRTNVAGIRVFSATTLEDIRKFHRIYLDTMDRRQAAVKYYFPLEYFVKFFEYLPKNSRFVLAELEGRIAASTLYLHDDDNVYSYLGGADHKLQNVRPTNAVVYDSILWALRNNKKRLILGGGHKPDDGIFRFKASFSSLRAQFQVYRRIHLPDKYEMLCEAWSDYYRASPGNYFPAYRSIPTVEEIV